MKRISPFFLLLVLLAWPTRNTMLFAQASAHSVTLTWTAPVIPTGSVCVLAGYNVKRSQSTGTEVTIASPTAATYIDTAVTGGQKYFYVVTATYGTTCTESAPSNEVTAQIPLDQGPSPTGLAASGVR